MLFEPLAIEGTFRISIELMTDERGFFARSFCAKSFAERGLVTDFVQRSISYNERAGTLRGLHYQVRPHAETKIVRCTRGAVFDVVVDMRQHSPSYRRWQSVELTADNRQMVYIPPGCAHGLANTRRPHRGECMRSRPPMYLPQHAASGGTIRRSRYRGRLRRRSFRLRTAIGRGWRISRRRKWRRSRRAPDLGHFLRREIRKPRPAEVPGLAPLSATISRA